MSRQNPDFKNSAAGILRKLAFGHVRVKRGEGGLRVTFAETLIGEKGTGPDRSRGRATHALEADTDVLDTRPPAAEPKARVASAAPAAPAASAARPAHAGASAATGADDTVAFVLADLRRALDASPNARRVMRHLTFVEQTLAKQGLAAVEALPMKVLEPAKKQLSLTISECPYPGLVTLAGYLEVSILEQFEAADREEARVTRPADLMHSGAVQVSESHLGDFDAEVLRHTTTSKPTF